VNIEVYERTYAGTCGSTSTLARMDRHAMEREEMDVEGILGFAERVLPRAADLWAQASLEQRQRLQRLFFLKGLRSMKSVSCLQLVRACRNREMKVWWTRTAPVGTH
jgi:hypothetical protein